MSNLLRQVEVRNRDGVTIFRNEYRDGSRSWYIAPWDIDGVGRTVVAYAHLLVTTEGVLKGPINYAPKGGPQWVRAEQAWNEYVTSH